MKKILFLFFLMISSLGNAQTPAAGASTPPARNAWDVKSIYSSAYSNQAGAYFDLFGTDGWAGSTLQEVTLGDGNAVQKMTNHYYSGIQLNAAGSLDVSNMTKLHFDVWSPNYTGMAIKLEGSNGSNKELAVPGTLTQGQWMSVDLNLSTYTDVTLANLKYIVPVTWGQNATLYIDNVYFYRPATSIPTPTIAFSIPTQTIGASAFSLTPTSDSSGAFTFSSSNTSVATISGSTVTIVGLGTTTITANQAAAGSFGAGSMTAPLVVTPTEAPTPPSRPTANVLSLFSGAYTNITGVAWNPNWGQAGSLSEMSINGNATKVLNNLNYQGTDFAAGGINVASMTTLHIDIFTLNCDTFKLYLIGGGENAVTLTPNHTGWNSYDIAMSNYSARTLTNIAQVKYEGSPAGSTVYFDNFYFYIDNSLPTFGAFTVASKNQGDPDFNLTAPSSNSAGAFTYTSSNSAVATISGSTVHITGPGTTTITATQAADGNYSSASTTASFVVLGPQAPTVAAPTPPARNTGDVKSLFSNAYTNVSGTNWFPNWGQSTQITDLTVAGNDTKKYYNMNYQGVEFASSINASSMTKLHIDIWTPNCTAFDVYPIVPGQPEQKVTVTPTAYGWNSFDINLSDYTIPLTNIAQMKFVATPGGSSTVFLDNIYFWKPNTTPTITGFNVPSKILGAAAFNLTAPTSTSPGAFTYTSSNLSVATISGSTVTIVGAGLTTITATQAASSPWVSGFTSATFEVSYPNPSTFAAGPALDPSRVISIFSDAYNNVAGTSFYQQWGSATIGSNFQIGPNNIQKYSNLSYVGTQFASPINAGSMEMLHLDIWTPDCTAFKVFLIANGENAVTLNPTLSGWNSFDIDLSLYSAAGRNLSAIQQFKFERDGIGTKTVYLDNIYFFTNSTKVQTSQVGGTLPALNTDILANFVYGVTDYRFKVVTNGTTEVLDRGNRRYFNLTALTAGAVYNTAYTVSVSTKFKGVWGAYGAESIVSTPLPPTSKVRAAQCSATLAALNTDIQADWLQFATDYRFKVVANGTTQVIERGSLRYFNLTALTAGASYNTAYTISVAVKHNGVWGDYSTECIVTTPVAPTTKVQASQCGATLPALSTDIAADWLQFATAYRFKVIVNGASYIVSPLGNRRYFRLTSLPVPITAGTAYTISVAAQFNGVWGDYATECNVTTPSTSTAKQATKATSIENADFSLVAYPNPSNSTFNLQVNGANEDAVSILVFDMTGRQIENKVVNATATENISLGQNYSAGIYNVIVSQGMNTKTVRLVKN